MPGHRQLVLLSLLIAAGLVSVLCSETFSDGGDWQPPRIVRLEGATKGANSVSPMYGTVFGPYGMVFGPVVQKSEEAQKPFAQAANSSYALVRPGELLGIMDGMMFPYRAEDGDSLTVEGGKYRMALGGKTVAVSLHRMEQQHWDWLREATPEDLAAVRLIEVGGLADQGDKAKTRAAERRKMLARLAEINPHLGLAVKERRSLRPALEIFDPAILMMRGWALTAEDQALLAAEPNLNTLMLPAEKQEDLAFVARLRNVRTLILVGWGSPGEDKPIPVLPTIPSLRTLIVMGAEMKDLGPVGNQPDLQELVIFLGSLTDVSGVAHMPNLRALSLANCKKLTDLSALSGLKHLRWLGLPPATTQEQFARICSEHPDLVILHAEGCKGITDLSPAAGLKRLQVLSVHAAASLEPVRTMASLRLLGLFARKSRKKVGWEKTEQALVKVLEANPDLVVVEAIPLCMGSGWILLLVPAVALAWWLAARRGRRRPRPDACHA